MATYSNLSITSSLPSPLTIFKDLSGNVIVTWYQPGAILLQTHALVPRPLTSVWTAISTNPPLYLPSPVVLQGTNTFFRLLLP